MKTKVPNMALVLLTAGMNIAPKPTDEVLNLRPGVYAFGPRMDMLSTKGAVRKSK